MRAVILDTGVANLSSLAFAVKRLGVEPIITREAAEIRAADRIFLPGVGTARAALAAIAERGLAARPVAVEKQLHMRRKP